MAELMALAAASGGTAAGTGATMAAATGAGTGATMAAATGANAAYAATAGAVGTQAATVATVAPTFSLGSFLQANGATMAMGAGTGFQMLSGMQQAEMAKGQLQYQASQDRMALAEYDRDSQQALRRTLAAQNNLYGSVGISPNTGSAAGMMKMSEAQAQYESSRIEAQKQMVNSGYAMGRQQVSTNRTGSIAGPLLNFGYQMWRPNQ